MSNIPSALYPTYNDIGLDFVKGKGCLLYDKSGTAYLDFTAGVAVNCLGHAHPYLVKKLQDQINNLWHISNLFISSQQKQLAQRLCDISFAKRVFFTNSGTEAVECAIKTARHYFFKQNQPEKTYIISFSGAFHGRTLGSLAATNRAEYNEGFAPLTPHFLQIDLNMPQAEIERQLLKYASQTAALIIELIQGEGGVNVIDNDFLKYLRDFCDQNNILLIFDEIQTGIGRSGHLFAYQKCNIVPDIMTLAKGLGGGFPIGACLAGKDIAQDMTIGTHGSTFGGNCLALSAANAVLDIVNNQDFLQQVKETSCYLIQGLTDLAQQHANLIQPPQGYGLLLGVKCCDTTLLLKLCRENKLLLLSAGNDIVRLLPALNVTIEEVDLALEKLKSALQKMENLIKNDKK